MRETIWTLAPPAISIVLALLTKKVYISLIIGIFSGALLYTNFSAFESLRTIFEIMSDKVSANMNIIIFLVLLGMIVSLMSKSGASASYGKWASSSIKTRKSALIATSLLGALIFVDDYFNCLTVGTVMRPVTDKHGITRAKLAYIIDATAAPICIIAPISSWAAAVGSSLPEGSNIDGFNLFLKTIPFNFYAILTIVMVAFMIIFDFDYGAMKKHKNTKIKDEDEIDNINGGGKVFDLIMPIGALIIFCILTMLYTGGILEDVGIVAAFSNCDASLSLVIGSVLTLVLIFILYIPRKIITVADYEDSFGDGLKSMAPAILILTFAWALGSICGEEYLNIGGYVSRYIGSGQQAIILLPALLFIVSVLLAFSTGTSWGTFSILIPIAASFFGEGQADMLTIAVASILAGAVCGDHMSPISDTTILASAGANCNHIEHVYTQIPYVLPVAVCSFIGYIIAGITANIWMSFSAALILLLAILTVLYRTNS